MRKLALFAMVFVLAVSVSGFANVCGIQNQVYCQEFDQSGNAYSSQNDTAGFGLFAQVYDNFTLGSNTNLTSIHFEGAYFNPPQQGPITQFTVQLFSDAGGQPGTLLQSVSVAGTASETFDGNFGGFPFYTYSVALPNWAVTAGTQYWISVYPDLAFPPQWGWASGNGGDGVSYQDFFGARTPLAADMAFALDGSGQIGTPEPSSLMLLGAGLLGFASKLRRK